MKIPKAAVHVQMCCVGLILVLFCLFLHVSPLKTKYRIHFYADDTQFYLQVCGGVQPRPSSSVDFEAL